MRDMTKSLFSASLAMSLFSIKQMMNLVTPRDSDRATNAFDAATQATGEDLGDMTHSLYSMGDDLQREIIDLISSSMTLKALNPAHMMELPLIQRSTDTLRPFLSVKNSQLLVREFRNKINVFNYKYFIQHELFNNAKIENIFANKKTRKIYFLGTVANTRGVYELEY